MHGTIRQQSCLTHSPMQEQLKSSQGSTSCMAHTSGCTAGKLAELFSAFKVMHIEFAQFVPAGQSSAHSLCYE